jgi:hypothetical protein
MRRPTTPADQRRKIKRLSRDTRAGYLMHFRIARDWAGDTPAGAITPADVDVRFYDALVEERGHVMANRCIAALSMAFQHGVDKLQWLTHNPFKGLEKVTEDGRLVMWQPDENIAFVQCADWLGWPDVADAHVVALMTAQSRIDILAMPELDLRPMCSACRATRPAIAYVPATRCCCSRLRAARERKARLFPGVTYRHEIINTETGAPYHLEGSRFSEKHRAVRAVASGLQAAIDQAFPIGAPALDYATRLSRFVPSIWQKRFQPICATPR